MIDTTGKTFLQVLDEISDALERQGKPCCKFTEPTDPDETPIQYGCAYGDKEGNHCSIGWLLPEERKDLMGYERGVAELITDKKSIGTNHKFIRSHALLLEAVQYIHDCSDYQPGSFPLRLQHAIMEIPESPERERYVRVCRQNALNVIQSTPKTE